MTPDFEGFLRALPAGSFVAEGTLVSAADLAKVPDVPHGLLPDSYRLFVSIIGPGYWVNDSGTVMSPSALHGLDSDCWEMAGFVALAGNAAGVGDYIAVNPADPSMEGERPVYYCGHDPFGYARAADSFEGWVREAAQASLAHERRYRHLDKARDESYRRYLEFEKRRRAEQRGSKRWWQLWR